MILDKKLHEFENLSSVELAKLSRKKLLEEEKEKALKDSDDVEEYIIPWCLRKFLPTASSLLAFFYAKNY